MKHKILCASVLGLSLFAAASASAADGYVTGNVNLRAGPDVSYPSVDMLPAGTSVVIYGCVDGWSWCDVSTGNDRGWMAGSFLQEAYEGRRVYVADYGVRIGIPIVSFVFGAYWGDHYRNRSWYGDRDHWSHIQPHYRPIARHVESHESSHTYSHSSHTPSYPANHGPQHPVPAAPTYHQARPVNTAPHNVVAHPAPHNAVVHGAPHNADAHTAQKKPAPHGHPNDDHKDQKDGGGHH
ncbi:MAG: SH3 domain-containing protein [Rudaea sp.]